MSTLLLKIGLGELGEHGDRGVELVGLKSLPQQSGFVDCPVREFTQLAFKAFPFPQFSWHHAAPLPSVMFNTPRNRIEYDRQVITSGALELIDNVTLERGR
jgi:hypothetical protein